MMKFCTVEYRPQSFGPTSEAAAPIFLLALEEDDALRVFFDPGWDSYVAEGDKKYISELLADLREQTVLQPKELFRRLGSLSLHPLRTRSRGPVSTAGVESEELRARFVEL